MPRRPRVNLIDCPQHIVQRGHNRAACFFGEEDYHCYLHWLKDAAAKYGGDVHAYALMTNHVHLLVSQHQRYRSRFLFEPLTGCSILSSQCEASACFLG